MEKLLAAFQESLKKLNVSKKDRLLLAVSGGLDSVVLTDLTADSGLDFGIAHVNFQLRREESNRDALFVQDLAKKYNKPFFIQQFDTAGYAEKEKLSIQVAARNLRYDWFDSFLGNGPDHFQFLVTAHHLDDNIETLMMHFFRGTGINGLTGMPEKKDSLLRPLLKISKALLKKYAAAKNLQWVEDSSNATDDYTRNYFRNQLIPAATVIFPELQTNMENNLHRFSEASMIYQQAINGHKKRLLKKQGTEMHIPILLLKKAVPLRTIIYEIIKDYHFSPAQTDEVIRLMDSSNGKYISSESSRIIKNRRWLIISPIQDNSVSHIVIEKNERLIEYPEGKLHIKNLPVKESETISKENSTAWLDADKIQFPLILRKWKSGDYFYPLGMKKKKKLARFFIDQKLSKTAKEKAWILVMDNHIIWVVGQRIDDRFSIRESTSNMLMIKSADA